MVSGPLLPVVSLLVFLASAHLCRAQKPDDWAVSSASIRFTVRLTEAPTHGAAGYFITLPDGGILPGPAPVTTVLRAGGGDELESRLLWHSRGSGMSVVFADPGGGGKKNAAETVHIYVAGSEAPALWDPDSKLRPSAILCTDPTRASLDAARALAARGGVGPTVHARNKAGIKQAPLSIGGDDTGRPRPASFYMLAHVVTADPGKTWIAPFNVDGEGEVRVDGKKLSLRKRIDKWGGTGAYVELGKGLHRVEILHAVGGTGPFSSHPKKAGLMYLTWRTPEASMAELGGVRSEKVPLSGTSRMETRLIKDSEIVRSGRCSLERIESQSGGPAAAVMARPATTYWFEGEAPLIVYEIEALTTGHPEDTRYSWLLPGEVRADTPSLRWIFPGFMENSVTLTVENAAGRSQAVHPFFGFSTVQTSLSNPGHREAFRAAITRMLEAYPTEPDPVASWGPSIWNNLIRTTEMGHGYDLLHNLFSKRWATVQEKLTPAQVSTLQDVYLDQVVRRDTATALRIVDALIAASEGPRRDELMVRKAEVLMYYTGDLDLAETGLKRLAATPGEMGEWARIRLGDIAFLGGDLNRATRAYADVEGRAREHRNRGSDTLPEDLVTTALVSPGTAPVGGPEETPAGPAVENPANFGVGALLDVSISENIDTLITGNYLLEARQALRGWEREFPLAKISGDYILLEARFFLELGDHVRARALLEPYCRQVDASSFLPDAVRLLITTAERAGTAPAEIREVVEKVHGNLKYHPVAEDLEAFLDKNPSKEKP